MSRWRKGAKDHKFIVLTIWEKPKSKADCYFCKIHVTGFNSRNKSKIKYANVFSVTELVLFIQSDKTLRKTNSDSLKTNSDVFMEITN